MTSSSTAARLPDEASVGVADLDRLCVDTIRERTF
jgi:hypothetical protein